MEQHAPQRTAISGPTLVRLLARLAQRQVAEPPPSLSDRLAEWLGWTDAITLSSVLNGAAPAGTSAGAGRASAGGPARTATGTPAGDDAQAWCTHARASLAQAIAAATQGTPSPRARAGTAPAEPTPDYADWRQRYVSVQQTMETDIAELRKRLRSTLAASSSGTPATSGRARLAGVDAVMERSLGARERTLLATVPTLLGAHFERLRDAAQPSAADDGDTGAAATSAAAWLRTFRRDMQTVLLAELDVRFQPVEGLLAALRNR